MGKKSKNLRVPEREMLMVLAVIVAATLVSITVFVMFTGPGARTPQGAVEKFVEGVNKQDYDMVLEATTATLILNDRERIEFKEDMREMMTGVSRLEIVDTSTIEKADITQKEKDTFANISIWLRDEHNLTVQDYVIQRTTLRVTEHGETKLDNLDIACLRIQRRWYIQF